MRRCIFCDGRAMTSEHAWPAWLVALAGRAHRAEVWFGPNARKEWDGAPITVKRVCRTCNNGWMCDLEGRARPLIGAMMQDLSIRLDRSAQHLIAAWCAKTAMVFECTGRAITYFYTDAERRALRSSLAVPDGTTVWLGRQHRSNFTYCHARHLSGGAPALGSGYVTTFAVGRLVMQAFTVRRHPEWPGGLITLDMRPGPWDRALVRAWPSSSSIRWPPPGWSFDEPDLDAFTERFRR